jgi:antitoxin YefM
LQSSHICTNFFKMEIANISEFRKDIKSYFDRVANNFETLIINRGKDSGIVVMSLKEYNS